MNLKGCIYFNFIYGLHITERVHSYADDKNKLFGTYLSEVELNF